ncbi:transposase [Azospirillum sp. A1-3]|uniref:IS701 family transposase n=1 Tax=Azospirillum sp. A1-3 TaxID=185874 RepID=UPI002076EFEE|nr:transposase [Azospirillum sp. A1-3]MCM8738564.1 transposase [Azospirillum sp. A1-3]
MVRPVVVSKSFVAWLRPYLKAVSGRTRATVAALAVGAVLTVGPRTVANALRVLGLADEPGFATFHRVLNRNAWSGLVLARTLLHALVGAFVPYGPVVIGVDHTLERRRGPCIRPASQYYDPVRSSKKRRVTSHGLRWLTAMLLVEVPFAGRIWGLPVLTALTPSRCWCQEHGRHYRSAIDWARAVLRRLHRWLPDRLLVAVMDGGFAALDLLDALSPSMIIVTRLRFDVGLFDPPPAEQHYGRPAVKGARQPSLRDRLSDPATVWRRAVQASRTQWRSGGWIEYASGTALWYHAGKPVVPILWVLVRYPDGRREPEAFLCTDPTVPPAHGAGMVQSSLVHGNHLRRKPRPHRDRDAAPMDRCGDFPHDAAAVRAVFTDHVVRAPTCRPAGAVAAARPVVPQARAHLRRCVGPPAPAPVVRTGLRHVARKHRHDENRPSASAPPHRIRLLRPVERDDPALRLA